MGRMVVVLASRERPTTVVAAGEPNVSPRAKPDPYSEKNRRCRKKQVAASELVREDIDVEYADRKENRRGELQRNLRTARLFSRTTRCRKHSRSRRSQWILKPVSLLTRGKAAVTELELLVGFELRWGGVFGADGGLRQMHTHQVKEQP